MNVITGTRPWSETPHPEQNRRSAHACQRRDQRISLLIHRSHNLLKIFGVFLFPAPCEGWSDYSITSEGRDLRARVTKIS